MSHGRQEDALVRQDRFTSASLWLIKRRSLTDSSGKEGLKMRRTPNAVRVCLLFSVCLAVCSVQPGVAGTHPPATLTLLAERLPDARIRPEATCAPSVRGEDPFDIVLHPDGQRAYVVNRSTDNLFVLDLATDRIAEVIDLYPEAKHPLGPAPMRVAVTPDGSRLLVTNFHDDSLTILTTTDHSVVETLTVGDNPTGVAVAPDGSLAYVANGPDLTVSVVDLTSTDVLTTIDVSGGGWPFAVTFAPDGRRAYVVAVNGPVYIIDPATHTVIDSIAVPDAGWAGDLNITSDSRTGYLASLTGNKIYVLDLASRSVTDDFAVAKPVALALSADENRLYVGTFGFAGESEYNLWMLNAHNGQMIAGLNFEHPGAPRLVGSDIQGMALTLDGTRLYTPSIDGESVFVVDAVSLKQIGIILTNPVPDFAPFRGVLSPDGMALYVASWTQQPTTVSRIDTRTLRTVNEIASEETGPCTSASWGLDITPDGKMLYVLASDSRCVLVIDTQNQDLVDSFQIPASGKSSHLTGIAIHPDGNKAYVLEHNGTIHVVDLERQAVIGTVTTTDSCSVVKLSPDGTRGYVLCNSDFSVLDATTDTLVKTIAIGSGGSHFEFLYYVGIKSDSSQYLVGSFFQLYVYDARTDTLVTTINLEALDASWLTLGQDFVFSPDDSKGYLALPDENAIVVFDANTWQVKAQIDTGRAPHFGTEPTWLLMDPNGSTLYVTNELSDNVLAIDTATNKVTDSVSLRKCRTYLPLLRKEQ
jgi:YVTN family beta-propeller protein